MEGRHIPVEPLQRAGSAVAADAGVDDVHRRKGEQPQKRLLQKHGIARGGIADGVHLPEPVDEHVEAAVGHAVPQADDGHGLFAVIILVPFRDALGNSHHKKRSFVDMQKI